MSTSEKVNTKGVQIFKACETDSPLLIVPIDIAELTWQNHSNYFSILWLQSGFGSIETDFVKAHYQDGQIYCFNNYQAFSLGAERPTKGILLLFHPNFFCIETYHHEVGCNGVLFNQVYDATPILLDESLGRELDQLLNQIQEEMNVGALATSELLLSYLKIFLIKLTRAKTEQAPVLQPAKTLPDQLVQLSNLINTHFARQHKPSFYADQLHVSLKTLSNNCQSYFKKSISTLIREKLILKAKWELLHTNNPVKVIAAGLGFRDEYYFSRFFKKHIALSPKAFRETEWKIRKGYLELP